MVPYSSDIEEAVLGAFILDPEEAQTLYPLFKAEYFFEPGHRAVWDAIEAIIREGGVPAFGAVISELEKTGKLDEVGGRAGIAELLTHGAPFYTAIEYAKQLEDLSVQRSVLFFASHLVSESMEKDGITMLSEMYTFANETMAGIHSADVEGAREILERVWCTIEERVRHPEDVCLHVGLSKLDEYQLFMPGNLIILAGRPGMGKSALASHIALEVARKDSAVLLFSLEMSRESIMERILANASGIPLTDIRRGSLSEEDMDVLSLAVKEVSELPIFIDDSALTTPESLMAKSRLIQARGRNKLGLIIVDYLQLLQSSRVFNNRVQEVTYISSRLKALARETNLPVLALSQLRRAVEDRNNKRPILADLRESGSIEQDADSVIFIHRDELYNPLSEKRGVADIIISKNRNGEVGEFVIGFEPRYAKFMNVDVTVVDMNEILER